MIIQCDHCRTKFRMDDSKLANGSVKVRCAKCKEVFVVHKEETVAEKAISQQPASAPLAEKAAAPQPESASSAGAESEGFSTATPGKSEDSFSPDSVDFSFDVESPSLNKETVPEQADSANEFDWHAPASSSNAAGADSAFDMSAFDTSIAAPNAAADMTAPPADDNDFNFGAVNYTAEATTSGGSSAAADSLQSDDFAMDFGDISFSGQQSAAHAGSDSPMGSAAEEFATSAAVSPQPANSATADDFVLSFNADSEQQSAGSSAADESESVNFGEFSFGEMDDSALAEPSKPVATPQEKSSAGFMPAASPEDELPPLSLSSRKKSSSLFPLLVILGAIILIIALVGSGVYFFSGPKAFSKVGLGFLVEWYGDKAVAEGSIALKGVTAAYSVNSTAGELFVVRGEAVNNFKKPRASIQIKVSLLGPGGTTLVTKSAYCGNSLSNDQLASLPLVKIEEIMNNQFGDSLANLGLKPGGTIPFVVVVSPVPKDATDYNVQVGGSTVATQ